jgi:hypothetical protein
LRIFENRVLRKIFVPKKEEGTGGWRRQRNEELHSSRVSPNIIRVTKSRRMGWARHVARMGAKRNACSILVGIREGKNHLEDLEIDRKNIRVDLREIGSECLDWIHLAQDRDQWRTLVNMVMNLRVP